jgi:uncharacterized protein (TIGR02118 family)
VIKIIFALRRRGDLTPDQFQRYWLEEHGPLARGIIEALGGARYVQSHTLDTELNTALSVARGTASPYDGVAEIWWPGSLEDLQAAFGSEQGQRASATLIEDEGRFIDLERSSIFLAEEHVIFESAPPAA